MIATDTSDCFAEFADIFVPKRQRRGQERRAYEGRTLLGMLVARRRIPGWEASP
jgi:hypothetical protein